MNVHRLQHYPRRALSQTTQAALSAVEAASRLPAQLQHPLDQHDHPVMPRLDFAQE
jgi:hypothetical protein